MRRNRFSGDGQPSVIGSGQIRVEVAKAQADVPMRFEGLPGEYLQVDWGEVRRFPFTQQESATRYVPVVAWKRVAGAG